MIKLSRIRDLCEEKRISINKCAKDLHITPSGLQKMMRDNTTKQSTLEKIANYFDVNISYFQDNNNNNINKLDIIKPPKVVIQIELTDDQVNKIIKNFLSNDFNNLLNKK